MKGYTFHGHVFMIWGLQARWTVVWAATRENQQSAYAKTKAQTSFVVTSFTAKLISAFVFATQIVQCLFFLNPKSQASSLPLCSVTVQASLCQTWLKTTLLVFSWRGSFVTKPSLPPPPHPCTGQGTCHRFDLHSPCKAEETPRFSHQIVKEGSVILYESYISRLK